MQRDGITFAAIVLAAAACGDAGPSMDIGEVVLALAGEVDDACDGSCGDLDEGDCVRGLCVDGQCVAHVIPYLPCDDGDACTDDDHCVPIASQGPLAATCRGAPRDCHDEVRCTEDRCVDGMCQNSVAGVCPADSPEDCGPRRVVCAGADGACDAGACTRCGRDLAGLGTGTGLELACPNAAPGRWRARFSGAVDVPPGTYALRLAWLTAGVDTETCAWVQPGCTSDDACAVPFGCGLRVAGEARVEVVLDNEIFLPDPTARVMLIADPLDVPTIELTIVSGTLVVELAGAAPGRDGP